MKASTYMKVIIKAVASKKVQTTLIDNSSVTRLQDKIVGTIVMII